MSSKDDSHYGRNIMTLHQARDTQLEILVIHNEYVPVTKASSKRIFQAKQWIVYLCLTIGIGIKVDDYVCIIMECKVCRSTHVCITVSCSHTICSVNILWDVHGCIHLGVDDYHVFNGTCCKSLDMA